MNTIKILLLGKTGVGKSSFINYFLGKDVAGIGVGEPCTQERTKYTLNEWEDCSIEIYDTKGLEVLDADNWSDEISRHLHEMSELDFFERYQTIFYCISAKKKIEIYELNAIKNIIESAEQPVHIILTHCDEIDCDVLDEREEYLRKNIADNICVYRITSVDKTKRNGMVIKKSGREKVLDGVFGLLWQDVSERFADDVADECRRKYSQFIGYIKNECLKSTNQFGVSKMPRMLINDDFEERIDRVGERIEGRIEERQNKVNEELAMWIKDNCIVRLKQIYCSYSKATGFKIFFDEEDICNIAESVFKEKTDEIMEAMNEQELIRKMDEIVDSADKIGDEVTSDNIATALKVVGKGVFILVTLKGRLKKLIEETARSLRCSLYDDTLKKEIYTKLLELKD